MPETFGHFIKKETLVQVFFLWILRTFLRTLFKKRLPPVAASEIYRSIYNITNTISNNILLKFKNIFPEVIIKKISW